jgi:excisionase family DNA binding protein
MAEAAVGRHERLTMDRRQLAALPAVLDVPTAAKALGLSRTAAYELIRAGEWPTPVFRLGRLIRIPTAPLLELLGIGAQHQPADRPVARRSTG